MLAPRHKVWLTLNGVFLMGPNYLRFLAAVDQTGTIREGGAAVGWSYRTFIQAVTWRIQGEFRTGSVGTGKASVSLQDGYVRYAPSSWAYVSRKLGELGVRKGRLLAQVQARF